MVLGCEIRDPEKPYSRSQIPDPGVQHHPELSITFFTKRDALLNMTIIPERVKVGKMSCVVDTSHFSGFGSAQLSKFKKVLLLTAYFLVV
jgi:hypothetical protein